MKKVKIIAIIGFLIISCVSAVEDSVLSSVFTTYERDLKSLTVARGKGMETLPKEETSARIIMSIYGDFMGHTQIEKTWAYLMIAKKQGQLTPFELELEQRLEKWGRKSVLTLLGMYPDLSKEDKAIADLFVEKIVPTWNGKDSIRSDREILSLVKLWSTYSLKKTELQSGPCIVQKIHFKQGMNDVGVEMPDLFKLTIKNGSRIYVSDGKLAKVDGGVFDGVSSSQKKSAQWLNVSTETKGFGLRSIIWRNNTDEGGVQILRGLKKEGGKEIYFVLYKGGNTPSLSKVIEGIEPSDLGVFVTRGRTALRNSLRGDEKYSSEEKICRYSSQIGLSKLIELLKADKLKEDQLRVYALLYADEISEGEFQDYPELENIVVKYK